MNGIAARLVALGLGLTAAGTTALSAAMVLPPANPLCTFLLCVQELVFPSAETRLLEEGPRRNALVRAEIARSPEHPWAGVYRGTGM